MAGERSLSLGGLAAAPAVTVREVAWHHLAAVALREAQAAEMLVHLCRTENLTGETIGHGAGTVAYTGVAFTPEGLPVGHAALRWNQDDIELQRVYVTPGYRGSATAAALLAAAEEAARALHVRRITVRPAGQPPDAAGFWERAGFTRVASPPACQSASQPCFEKMIA